MKKFKTVAYSGLVLASLASGGVLVQAAQQAPAQTQLTTNLASEKQKALQAGYTEAQFTAMVQQPKLASVTPNPEIVMSAGMKRDGAKTQTADDLRNAVITEALKQKGVKFETGGNSPTTGFDSSGFVQYVFKQAANIDLPRATIQQETKGEDVSLASLKPGDLLFYGKRGQTYSVTIYIGNGQMIYAPEPGDVVKVTNMQYWKPDFARRIISDDQSGNTPGTNPGGNSGQKEVTHNIYRLYNPYGGKHHFTQNKAEADNLISLGWNNEGIGWVAPDKGTPVYRLYNPNNGRHHYTVSAAERDNLVQVGWNSEGIGWQSGGTIPVYRVYNPYAPATEDSHHYTVSAAERDNLVKLGWRDEGIGWYSTTAAQ